MTRRPRRPRTLRNHELLDSLDEIEQMAADHGGQVVYGAGWATLDLGPGRRYCARDEFSAVAS